MGNSNICRRNNMKNIKSIKHFDINTIDNSKSTSSTAGTTFDARSESKISTSDILKGPPSTQREKIDRALDYLVELNEPEKIVVESRAFLATLFLEKNSVDCEELCYALLNNSDAIELFGNILIYYIENVKQLVIDYKREGANKSNAFELDYLIELLSIICNVTIRSKELCQKFHENFATKALLEYLNNEEFVEACTKSKVFGNYNSSKLTIGFFLLRIIIGSFHNISATRDEFKSDFYDLKATDVLIKFSKDVSSYDFLRSIAHMSLLNVISESEMDSGNNIDFVIEDIIELISQCAETLADGDDINRIPVDIENINDDGSITYITEEICIVLGEWHLVELIQAIYKVALNDKMKSIIYNDFNIKSHLEKIIYFGNNTEKEYAVKLLWQLCYDKRISENVHQNINLYKYIFSLSNSEDTASINLKRYSEGIIWLTENLKTNFVKTRNEVVTKYKRKSLQHSLSASSAMPAAKIYTKTHDVMISYSKQNTFFCEKLKKYLKSCGLSVCCVAERDFSFERMKRTIESSRCMIICVTEKYKQNPMCRAEAECALISNTPMIPVIIQSNYAPDGWLNLLKASRTEINFTTAPTEISLRRLNLELRSYIPEKEINPNGHSDIKFENVPEKPIQKSLSISNPQSVPIRLPLNLTNTTKNTAQSWSAKEVEEWAHKNKFDKRILKSIKNFNGDMLKQLNLIRNKSPEYFFVAISKNGKCDLVSVLKFTQELEKLFNTDLHN